jgi:hypothetical protein
MFLQQGVVIRRLPESPRRYLAHHDGGSDDIGGRRSPLGPFGIFMSLLD